MFTSYHNLILFEGAVDAREVFYIVLSLSCCPIHLTIKYITHNILVLSPCKRGWSWYCCLWGRCTSIDQGSRRPWGRWCWLETRMDLRSYTIFQGIAVIDRDNSSLGGTHINRQSRALAHTIGRGMKDPLLSTLFIKDMPSRKRLWKNNRRGRNTVP